MTEVSREGTGGAGGRAPTVLTTAAGLPSDVVSVLGPLAATLSVAGLSGV